MIGDGFKLLVMGMGYVVIFLSVMVLVILLVAKVLEPFTHLLEEKATEPRRASGKATNKNLIAAAIAAVHMYRNKKE